MAFFSNTYLHLYNLINDSLEKLNAISDDIYTYWFDAIYNRKHLGKVYIATTNAYIDNAENIDFLKSNDKRIDTAYKKLKNSILHDEAKTVMAAYKDYYEFTVNIGGSLKMFLNDKENKKKNLSSALRNFYDKLLLT